MKTTNIFKRFSLWLLSFRLSLASNIKNLEFSVSATCLASRWFLQKLLPLRLPSKCLNWLLVSI